MNIGSHNSFSYLPVRKWWMKYFAFTARCQRVSIYEQYALGVRLFDMRLRFDVSGGIYSRPYLCHGLIEYETDWNEIYNILDFLNQKGDCYMRMALETRKPDLGLMENFRRWCKCFQAHYTNVKFFGGNDRTDWLAKNPIFQFDTTMPEIEHRYASATSRFNNRFKILRYIDDLYPLAYAKKYNLRNRLLGTSTCNQWIMLDFVDI